MGFPLVTVGGEGTSNEEQGYRIPRDLYELPDPGLDESELAALRLAASAVQLDGDWGREAVTRALRKLGGAVGDEVGAAGGQTGRGPAVGLEADPATTPRRPSPRSGAPQRVEFRYRGERRLVDPWSLSFHRGRWYLAGLDHGRGEERLFRLDRVEGALGAVGAPGAFERPGGASAAPPPAWRMGDDEEIVARVLVDADHAEQARRTLGPGSSETSRPDGAVEFGVAVTNVVAFRSFVLGFLEHAEILGPRRFATTWSRTSSRWQVDRCAMSRERAEVRLAPAAGGRPVGRRPTTDLDVDEVCRRFGVEEKELLDDLNLLFMCGLYPFTPDMLIDVTVADGRVWITMADYFRRPLRLNPQEGLALARGDLGSRPAGGRPRRPVGHRARTSFRPSSEPGPTMASRSSSVRSAPRSSRRSAGGGRSA